MNLLTDIPAGDPKKDLNAVVEISTGDQTKYEYDKNLGILRVDRVLYTAFTYPFNYGFVPGTWSEDEDPLDIVILSSRPIVSGALVKCRLIGVLTTEDEEGNDAKLISVPAAKADPFYAHINNVSDLPEPEKAKIRHFYENMKSIEPGKWVKVTGWESREKAIDIVSQSILRYQNKFPSNAA